MSSAAKEILEAALKLPPEERERLVEELAASLPTDFASKDIERAWLDAYHARVRDTLAPLIDDETRIWLSSACAPLEN